MNGLQSVPIGCVLDLQPDPQPDKTDQNPADTRSLSPDTIFMPAKRRCGSIDAKRVFAAQWMFCGACAISISRPIAVGQKEEIFPEISEDRTNVCQPPTHHKHAH
ncbi:hypothetical protein [Pleomorphomonas carboxyditropha]|uniref:hypothetical protein n=1 Tax=Pleomorphomonas carboxyditropha TaxID=2023338 RepID=UPI00105453B0|nr:hypothetical protein [Pleomorphomonas carboxyditropha]